MHEPWYKDAVMYAVDVEKFADGDGDGVGDFKGLLGRLDHIAHLGATCLWLLPFYPSPRRDNGYDVTDYYGIDPRFGTLDDFTDVIQEAGARGIRVIVDLVMNHTSDAHPWFRAGRRDPRSRFGRYYIWEDAPPPVPLGWGSAFPGEESTLWTYDDVARSYYYHRFYRYQPQLDAGNAEVREQMCRVMEFWLELGVAGFRMDAVPIMVGPDPAVGRYRDTHGWLREFRSCVAERRRDTVLLGEVDLDTDKLVEFFGEGDELNMLLDFFLDSHLFHAFATGRAEPVTRALRQLPAIPSDGQWANFLRNLDELNLGWLTPEERGVVYDAFAPEEGMRIYDRGIRRRLAPMLGGDRARLEMAFSLLFSLPGAPLVAYGDEIGIGDDLSLGGRDAVRVPMQWSAGENAGFSTAHKRQLVRPVVSTGRFGHKRVNVEDQRRDPDSFLNWMRRLVSMRRSTPEFGKGAWQSLTTGSVSVFAHQARWRNWTAIAVHNLSDKPATAHLEVRDHTDVLLDDLFGNGVQHMLDPLGVYTIELPRYGYQWYRVRVERPERRSW